MKGIVFTTFLEMVEETHGIEIVDKVMSEMEHGSSVSSYTAVGNYPHGDLVAMVGTLSGLTGLSASQLVQVFGRYLLRVFRKDYAQFFEGVEDSMSFLSGIESVIHSEVRKLYPDAKPPKFLCEIGEDGSLVMEYSSDRGFADLAEGLIRETLLVFKEDHNVVRKPGKTNDAHSAIFVITPKKSA